VHAPNFSSGLAVPSRAHTTNIDQCAALAACKTELQEPSGAFGHKADHEEAFIIRDDPLTTAENLETQSLQEKLHRLADGLWFLKWYDDVCDEADENFSGIKKEIASLSGQHRDYVFARLAEMNRAAEERPAYTEH
jgi:hypothetical protein